MKNEISSSRISSSRTKGTSTAKKSRLRIQNVARTETTGTTGSTQQQQKEEEVGHEGNSNGNTINDSTTSTTNALSSRKTGRDIDHSSNYKTDADGKVATGRKRRATGTAVAAGRHASVMHSSNSKVLSTSSPPPEKSSSSTAAAAAATSATKMEAILYNAFANPYIKSILQQQQQQHQNGGCGILLTPAIHLIRQSASLFMYKFITAIAEQQQQQPHQTESSTRTATTTTTRVCGAEVLGSIRQLIANNVDYQFLTGTLDNIEQDTINLKSKKKTSILLPESLSTGTNKKTASTKNPTEKRQKKNEITKLSQSVMNDIPAALFNTTVDFHTPTNINGDDASTLGMTPPVELHKRSNGDGIDKAASSTSTNVNRQQQCMIRWDEDDYD